MAAGRKTGGRAKGVRNRRTENEAAAIAAGITPLAYLLSLLHQEVPEGADVKERIAIDTLRFEAAKAAAPYVHAKLANVEIGNKPGEAFKVHLLPDDAGLL